MTTLKDHRKKFLTDKAAAVDLGADYMTYRRWLAEEIYSPEGSAWRRILATEKGVELPRRRKFPLMDASKRCQEINLGQRCTRHIFHTGMHETEKVVELPRRREK